MLEKPEEGVWRLGLSRFWMAMTMTSAGRNGHTETDRGWSSLPDAGNGENLALEAGMVLTHQRQENKVAG